MPQLYVPFYSFLSQLSSCSAITLGIPWNDANNQTKETCTQDERIRKARLQEFCRLDPLPFFMLFSVFVSYTGIWYPHRMPVRFYVSVFPYSSSCRYSLHFPLTDPSCKQMHPKMFDHTTITRIPYSIVSRFQPYTSRVFIPIPFHIPISLSIPIPIIFTTLPLSRAWRPVPSALALVLQPS
jgi:hypothetical protein